MITHLAMNSHPNPKKVLVVGGGDGGVLREVIKHESVEEAILCDIDEAVIRLSKQYLPGMSVSYQHPKVKTFIGDGFKFLADRKGEFDVIITDSSDPEGPAESLFQQPYFQLLHDALREGGVITTQGCMPDFHLSLMAGPGALTDGYPQLKTNGSTSSSFPTSRRPAKTSSRRSNTRTRPFPPTRLARLASWSAARTPRETSPSRFEAGLPRRRRSCANTTARKFTRLRSCFPTLRRRR